MSNKKHPMTSYVFLWEDTAGERHWEAVEKNQIKGFLTKLIEANVNLATVMVAYSPLLFHWVWPEYHRNLSDVNFHQINNEIYGTEPVPETRHKPVDVPRTPEPVASKYGWIAPDGRFFGCDYQGHSALADRIVGDLESISNPEEHLENLGWAKITNGQRHNRSYALYMGLRQKLTDKQLTALTGMGLDTAFGISDYL